MKKSTVAFLAVVCTITIAAASLVILRKIHPDHFPFPPLPWEEEKTILRNEFSLSPNDLTKEEKESFEVKGNKIIAKEGIIAKTIKTSSRFRGRAKDALFVTLRADKAAVFKSLALSIVPVSGPVKPKDLVDYESIVATKQITKDGSAIAKTVAIFGDGEKHEEVEACFSLSIPPGGTVSEISVYNLAPFGFFNQEKAEYVFAKLTAQATLGGDLTFERSEINRAAKEFEKQAQSASEGKGKR